MKLKLFKSEFLSNLSTQMLGTGIGQVVPLLIMPLLTRLYSEEEFGLFSSFLAYSAVLIVATGGRYYVAIILPKKEKEALKVFSLSIILTILYTLFLFIVCLIIFYCLPNSLNAYGLIFFIPIYVGLFGLWQSFFNLSVRGKRFELTASSKVIQATGYATISSLLGFVLTPIGLVIGKISGVVFSLYHLKTRLKLTKETYNLKNLKEVAITYSDYPKYSILPTFLDTLSIQSLVFLIGYYYTQTELGFYGLTNMCLMAPLGLVGISFRDVFYQRITHLINAEQIKEAKNFFLKSTLILASIGVFIGAVLFFMGEPVFSLVFGEKWSMSGKLASILSISLIFKLTVSPLSSVLNATNNVRTISLWQTIYFVTTFSTLLLTILYFRADIYLLLKVYVLHEAILYSFYYFLQFNSLKQT
ncbi:lipopolysaccharide biosynthesis protein [Algibacter sp. 2305UL17-15]|uniref:lipopolysaccharide biosynthesis protein n=1 Tax=Algibacter sp. 2305UL17-15 TaxID=3231268 RepID=UPI0034578996